MADARVWQWPSSGLDELGVQGQQYKDGNPTTLNVSFYVPMASASITDLRTFAGLPLVSAGIAFNQQTSGPPGQDFPGTLTSLSLASVPEPGSIVVFSVFAVAAGIQVHRNRRRAEAARP
jgi:hypothetical protein